MSISASHAVEYQCKLIVEKMTMSEEKSYPGRLQRWRDFAEETTMHGVKYISQRKVHMLRR